MHVFAPGMRAQQLAFLALGTTWPIAARVAILVCPPIRGCGLLRLPPRRPSRGLDPTPTPPGTQTRMNWHDREMGMGQVARK